MQNLSGTMSKWPAAEPTALPQSAQKNIALIQSKNHNFLYLMQTPGCPAPLAIFLPSPIANAFPSTNNVPFSRLPYILLKVIGSDLPWIPVNQGPNAEYPGCRD